MFRGILGFELRYQLRQPTFWVIAALFFFLTFLATASENVQVGGNTRNLDINANFVIMQTMLIMTMFGVFVSTAFCANAVLRDADHRMDELVFSTRVNRFDYVIGRFTGAFIVVMLVMVICASGIFFGSLMPWLDTERLAPAQFFPYLWTLAVLVLPGMLFTAATFFGVATVTRSLMSTYVAVVGFFILWVISQQLLSDPELLAVSSMLDPFGIAAFSEATRYWTVFERNGAIPPLEGLLLWNRIAWTAAGLVLLAITYALFAFRSERRQKAAKRKEGAELPAAPAPLHPPHPAQQFGRGTAWRQFLMRALFEVRAIVRSVPFFVILAMGLFNVVGAMLSFASYYGTDSLPLTRSMIDAIQGAFLFILLIIVVYYAGEIVWRERQNNIGEIIDATPVPNGVLFASKLVALLFVIVSLLAVAIVTGMVIQLAQGFTHLEPALYVFGVLVVNGWPFYLMAVLAIFFQVIGGNKWIGMLLMIGWFAASLIADSLGFEHNLYQFAATPSTPYSDMNGYGHFLLPWSWFSAYWTVFAIMLAIAAHLLWQRGMRSGWKGRLRYAAAQLRGPVGAGMAVSLLAFAAIGAFIFYNTNVLNEYVTEDDREALQADYEKTYIAYRDLPQLSYADVYADVDIHPETRRFDVRATLTLKNRHDAPIDSLHLTLPRNVDIVSLEIPGAQLALDDDHLRYRIYTFDEPVLPGAQVTVMVHTAQTPHGFSNSGNLLNVVNNGTFFNNFDVLPFIGFDDSRRLQERSERRKHDLEPIERMRAQDDPVGLARNYVSGDWMNFETVVSTSPGQVAIAPGYLEREWTQDGRRYFHYRMDAPILSFWSYLSADYEVHSDAWNDVAIEIYYQPGHDYNIARMVEAIKDSLAYFTANFGPYQHRQVRIVEFPAYATFAQSFPNTIPFSESIGFVADLRDPEDIDYVYYVTAHEVAHQWWAHQVISANVKGATVLSETLSQYSALMVLEQEYGATQMQRFLKYELDRYLRGRGGEVLEENPLALNENQQYIHYQKGSVAMYALREYLGEDKVNAALRSILDDWRFRSAPWPTSQVLVDALRVQAAPEQQQLISDLFDRIVLWDLKLEKATIAETGDGRWAVDLTVLARKLEATGKGEETEVPLAMPIEIALFGAKPEQEGRDAEPLYLERHMIRDGANELHIELDEKPESAGVDPYVKLIDRATNDNRRTLEST